MLHPTWNTHLGADLWGQRMCTAGGAWGVTGSPTAPFPLPVLLWELEQLPVHYNQRWIIPVLLQLWALLAGDTGGSAIYFIKQDMKGFRAVLKVDVWGGSPGGEAQPALLELFWAPGW